MRQATHEDVERLRGQGQLVLGQCLAGQPGFGRARGQCFEHFTGFVRADMLQGLDRAMIAQAVGVPIARVIK